MKYVYVYKTSDGGRREGEIDAPGRDEAFAELRSRGIRPIKVVAADGAKANGEMRGVRKRVVTAIAVATALLAGVLAFWAGESNSNVRTPERANAPSTSPRHQIYGDPAMTEEFARGRFGEAFSREGDRMLAWFAQPGKFAIPKDAHFDRTGETFAKVCGKPEEFLAADVEIGEGEARETRELKQIVNGMRAELRAYLANGNGTLRSYWRRLIARSQQEAQIYERTRRELEKESNPAVWEQKNEALRNLGLRTIPNEEEK